MDLAQAPVFSLSNPHLPRSRFGLCRRLPAKAWTAVRRSRADGTVWVVDLNCDHG